MSEINSELIPRCDKLDGSTLRIKPSYTEAGYFCEANCITVVDREGRTALYVPFKALPDSTERVCLTHNIPVYDNQECKYCWREGARVRLQSDALREVGA
jgi:hypothetical protein